LVAAATPEPGVTPSAVPPEAGSAALIVTASVDIARLLVNVGVVLVVLSFAVMLLTVVATTPALMTEIKKLIEAVARQCFGPRAGNIRRWFCGLRVAMPLVGEL
jgi:hypothetical protein